MSYLCGIGKGMSIAPRRPQVKCDGCGFVLLVSDSHVPPTWLLDGKPVPGWTMTRTQNNTRQDYCPRCRPAQGAQG